MSGSALSDEDLSEKIADGIDAYVNNLQFRKVDYVSVDDDPVIGDEDAPITIVEFSDFECPFCQSFYNDTYPALKEKYVDTGIAKIVYRDFPLDSHANALPSAAAAECAFEQGGNEAFFAFHDALFESESLNNSVYNDIATDLGLDLEELATCMESEETATEILADRAEGASYGVGGTPSFFINGYALEGAQPLTNFEEYIQKALDELEADSESESE